MRADGGDSDTASAAIGPLFDEVESVISESAVRGTSWEPPADTIPLSGDCQRILDDGAANDIFDTETPLVVGRAGGGWSLEAASWARFDAMPCHVLFNDADLGAGYITWLPGGDWAYPSDEAGEVVDLPALEGDDRLIVNCRLGLAGQNCSADLAVGHNWIRVTTNEAEAEPPPGHAYSITPRDSAIAVAEAILAELRG